MERRKKTGNKTVMFLIILILLFVVSLTACIIYLVKKGSIDNSKPFAKPLNANSKIGISYLVTGTVPRHSAEIKDEGLARYPVYGKTFVKASDESDADFTALRQAILDENAYLNADPNGTLSTTCTNYDSMDSDGYLYYQGEPVYGSDGARRRLYKHTASQGMYYGDVEDSEPAVVKRITISPKKMGNYITGLYAPAGEVIKLTISAEDLTAVDNFYVYVGPTLANGKANNIWIERDFVRMPVIANKMPVSTSVCSFDADSQTYTCYFGSYLGGPIYIGSPKNKIQFGVEISGAVEYPHLIYGLTTETEYNRLLKSSAPYFDMEVFDRSFRFSADRTYSDNYSYAELCQSALLWDKIAQVSQQVPTGSSASFGIVFLFDPFVARGGAVAFVGQNTVNCPYDWIDGCLNVEKFVENGSWGNIHEFNHHFQNFGLPNGGEVTNNAISLVEYSLFTRVSSNRSLNDDSLKEWNIYTDPSRSLRELLSNTKSAVPVETLDAYATVLHSFGQSVFINSTKDGSGVDKWFKNLCNLTHYNFSYYFTELLHSSVSASVVEEINQCGYPMYVPVASIYQTGTKYNYNDVQRHITTAQPFEFEGESVDFSVKSMLHLPEGFAVTNVAVGNPQYGHITKLGDDSYRFVPAHEKVSGDIDITISITKNDGSFEVEDVVLVFGFKQQQKRIAERTTYYFENDLLDMFEDVDDAVNRNYIGYVDSAKFDSCFEGKECSAVWWDSEGVELNSITEYNSKIYINKTNTYRFSIRGKYANLYISLDGKNYELVAKADSNYNNSFAVSVENNEYKDYDLVKGQVVYVKAVVMHIDVEKCAFVAGIGGFSDGIVSLDDMTKRVDVYNVNYVPEPSFVTDYYYSREYSIQDFAVLTDTTSSVVSTNFLPWDSTTELDNLFDGDLNTFMHNKQYDYIGESTPFEMVVDLGRVIKANKVTMYGRSKNTQTPTSFKIFGGLTQENLTLLCEYSDKPLQNGCHQDGYFDLSEFRYYKLVVTKTNANYICLSKIEFGIDFENGKLFSPDDENVKYFGKWQTDFDLSMFGHSYTAQSGRVEFEFTGTQVAIISKVGKSAKFLVSVDGAKEVQCEFDGKDELLYISGVLKNTKHKIVIRPLNEINIVAFASK